MKYLQEIDPGDFNRPQVILARLVRDGANVLDVGCAGGRVARLLENKGCHVVGIEVDPERARLAREICAEVVEGDVEDVSVVEKLAGEFDAIICSDVLEHLRDPGRVLRALRNTLGPGGCLYASIPNLLQWRVRWKLLRGEFQYDETGIFDETHLRFFSYESAKNLCCSSGYRVVAEHFSWDIPFANRMGARLRRHPDRLAKLVTKAAGRMAARLPGVLAGHLIFVLEPDQGAPTYGTGQELQPS
ncbi:class I SAM-dependent methyltransferase [Acidobacteria bacterium AH-259-O06]|nr:class I SAM-dependent methyltransferase [Acidobacteria bacterium AH-259-O06]